MNMNFQKQVQWYLTLERLLQDLIELGERDEELAVQVFNPGTIREVVNLFPVKLNLELSKLPGKMRDKLANIKERLKTLRTDAQILDKNLQGEGGGKFTGGGGSVRGLGGGGAASKSQAHATYKQPQRNGDCRVCGVLETDGEKGLYGGHFSSWPTGCPKFIRMTADKRFNIIMRGQFCCLSPEVIFTPQHLDEASRG